MRQRRHEWPFRL